MCIYQPTPITQKIIERYQPTRLAIKELAGQFYFCKSIAEDIQSYPGSGVRWKNRIKKYGKENIKTLWVSDWYHDSYEIQQVALHFSKENQIVESDKWANMKPENGLDGGITYQNGRNPFSRREDGTSVASDMVLTGLHPWTKNENGESLTSIRTKNGLNPLSRREDGTSVQSDLVKNGNHNLIGGEVSRKINNQRLSDGTHNWLDSESQRQKILKYISSDGYRNPSSARCSCLGCHKETNLPGLGRFHKECFSK